MRSVVKGMMLFFVVIATVLADASELHVDVVKIGPTQYVVVEKNGVSVRIPATNEEIAKDKEDNNILKRACSVLKCKDF